MLSRPSAWSDGLGGLAGTLGHELLHMKRASVIFEESVNHIRSVLGR